MLQYTIQLYTRVKRYTAIPCLEITTRRRVAGFLKLIAHIQFTCMQQLKTDSKILYSC